jgi:peptidoglycan hydrolase-like protein with peptidoglycan-binding domain
MRWFPIIELTIVVLAMTSQLSYGQEPARTKPRILNAAVGADGPNLADDVRWVQVILNQIPSCVGGAEGKLQIDGIFGPQTAAAVARFEKIQLRTQTGQVAPDSALLQRLAEFNNFSEQQREGDPVAWGAVVTSDFRRKTIEVAQRLQIEPDHLMAAMAFETAETFSPAIQNAAGSGATGLIQFMPQTAKGLGTTTEALQAMSAVEQLAYVEKYFEPYRGRCHSIDDVYMAILWPRAVGKHDEFVLFTERDQPKTYQQNRGLDLDKDGRITKQEAARLVQKKLEKGRQEEFRR